MTGPSVVNRLLNSRPLVAPSMLKCDFANLSREVALLEAAGAQLLHFDVMDGHFVPNLSYGALVIERVRTLTDLPFEAHLMISEPDRYLNDYVNAGCNIITFHVEAVPDPIPLLRRIRNSGVAAGLTLNPGTPVASIAPALPDCDLVLVMSVQPGFGGQKFQPAALDRIRQLRGMINAKTLLSVDGGIGPETISATAAAGADVFVVGSALFEAPDYREAIDRLQSAAAGAAVPARTKTE
jgi:ribulose-phosphate 3-epimerase